MSVRISVLEILCGNPQVEVAICDVTLFSGAQPFQRMVDLYVAPKSGLYLAHELQDFLQSLIPEGILPTSRQVFREWSDEMMFGRLYFHDRLSDGEMCRVCVRLYPDTLLARLALHGMHRDGISRVELDRYREPFVSLDALVG